MSARLLTYTSEISLITEVCCNCGVAFAMPLDMQERRKKDRQSFFCPAGHSQSYTAEPLEEKLRKQVAQLELDKQNLVKRREWAEQEARVAKADAEKARRKAAKLKQRAAAGVCPVAGCHRTVKQMAAHISTKHPDYKP